LNISKGEQEMEKIYKTLAEVPKWYQPSVNQMILLGGITPGPENAINISEDMCRIYTSLSKIGLLGALAALKGEN
jgi:hypothetical protein